MTSSTIAPPDIVVRIGGWLFRQRTWLPVPCVAILLVLPAESTSAALPLLGGTIVVLGELLRIWGVRQIGVVSRTRSDRLGPLVDSGPFARVRNPLYLGNIALWVGFALGAHLPWVAPVIAVALALEYHAIVRWEEQLLEARIGAEYRAYAARVPRWLPTGPGKAGPSAAGFSLRDTLRSERGTLIAIAAGALLLWLKASL